MKKTLYFLFLSAIAFCFHCCDLFNSESTTPNSGDKPQSYTFDATGYADGYGYVDLGLSVPWATCNVGAKEPMQIGNHYSWATTTPYTASAESYYNIDP